MTPFLVVCGNRVVAETRDPQKALEEASKCRDTPRIYVYTAVLTLEPAASAAQLIAGLLEAVHGSEAARPAKKEAARHGRVAVVFDQMFKRFAEVLERELPEYIVFHEVLGRGIERPIKVSDRVYQQPARDDYDVLSLLEKLARESELVVFFTGDKRLAAQARTLPRVVVEYLPPGELAGKEMAIKLMKQRILDHAGAALGMS